MLATANSAPLTDPYTFVGRENPPKTVVDFPNSENSHRPNHIGGPPQVATPEGEPPKS